MKKNLLSKNIYTVDDFWTRDQCDAFIKHSEEIGYSPATIQTENGPRLLDFVRNNNRVMFKDVALADALWHAMKSFAPEAIGNSIPKGVNELFRFYRYEPGQMFKKHRDNSFIRNEREGSYYTFMIYLNDDFEGGETTFDKIVVKPRAGSALFFYHYLEHEGTEVTKGTKYVHRTDI
ncbi:MAG TPA: 2OG-Fe(II) oxygenase, partial [Cyclobacteriaceae bacterium]